MTIEWLFVGNITTTSINIKFLTTLHYNKITIISENSSDSFNIYTKEITDYTFTNLTPDTEYCIFITLPDANISLESPVSVVCTLKENTVPYIEVTANKYPFTENTISMDPTTKLYIHLGGTVYITDIIRWGYNTLKKVCEINDNYKKLDLKSLVVCNCEYELHTVMVKIYNLIKERYNVFLKTSENKCILRNNANIFIYGEYDFIKTKIACEMTDSKIVEILEYLTKKAFDLYLGDSNKSIVLEYQNVAFYLNTTYKDTYTYNYVTANAPFYEKLFVLIPYSPFDYLECKNNFYLTMDLATVPNSICLIFNYEIYMAGSLKITNGTKKIKLYTTGSISIFPLVFDCNKMDSVNKFLYFYKKNPYVITGMLSQKKYNILRIKECDVSNHIATYNATPNEVQIAYIMKSLSPCIGDIYTMGSHDDTFLFKLHEITSTYYPIKNVTGNSNVSGFNTAYNKKSSCKMVLRLVDNIATTC